MLHPKVYSSVPILWFYSYLTSPVEIISGFKCGTQRLVRKIPAETNIYLMRPISIRYLHSNEVSTSGLESSKLINAQHCLALNYKSIRDPKSGTCASKRGFEVAAVDTADACCVHPFRCSDIKV